PGRTIVIVVEGVKSQEALHQDLQTWLGHIVPDAEAERSVGSPKQKANGARTVRTRKVKTESRPNALYFPAWEILPHESRLPHADVISERLEVLVALAAERRPAIVVASVTALLQRTFRPETLREKLRTLKQGETIDPLDLVEWLEAQGYEPEAQVN